MINLYANQSQTCQLLKILKTVKSGAINFRLNWYRKSILIIERVVYVYIHIYIYIDVEFLASHFNLSKFTGWVIIEELSIRWWPLTLLVSWGQKNSCTKILLCWFIVMIWVLVCNNMYQYECHFGFFYRNPTILEQQKDASECLMTLIELVNKGSVPYCGSNSSTGVSLSEILFSFMLEKYNVCDACGLRFPHLNLVACYILHLLVPLPRGNW